MLSSRSCWTILISVIRLARVELLVREEDMEQGDVGINASIRNMRGSFNTSNPKGQLRTYFEKVGYPKVEQSVKEWWNHNDSLSLG